MLVRGWKLRHVLVVFISIISFCGNINNVYADQPKEKNMVTPIVSEQFPDRDFRGRGWDVSSNPRGQIAHDSVINRNYLRLYWPVGGGNQPEDWQYAGFLPFDKTYSEITVRYYVKLVKWDWKETTHFLGAFLHPFDWPQRNECAFEPTGGAGYPRWGIMLDSANTNGRYKYTWSGNLTSYTIGTWYEHRIHIKSNSGQMVSDGEYILEIRPYHGNDQWGEWQRIVTHSKRDWPYTNNYNPDGWGRIGIRAYINTSSTPANNDEIHIANYEAYEGNQLRVDLDNGSSGDPLIISNHNVTTTSNTATLSWDTNKEANTAVDYGPTEARGTVTRDDNNALKHVINLADLTPNTTYYYRYSSRTPDGETVMDQENSTFVTKESGIIEGSLGNLTDVTLNNPVEGQVLMYQNDVWVNVDARPLVEQLVEEILGKTNLVVNNTST